MNERKLVTLLGLLTCTCIPTEQKNQVWTFHFLGSPIVFCLMALAFRLRPRQRGTKEAALNLSSLISTGMLPLPRKCIPFLALEWDPSFSKGMQEKRMFRGPGSGFQQLLMFSPHSQWDLKIIEILKVPICPPTPPPPPLHCVNQSKGGKKSNSDHLVGCIWTRQVIVSLVWISESDFWFCFPFLLWAWPHWTGLCLIAPCRNNQPPLISLMFI